MSQIQMQADDFFNAYLVLRANNEAMMEKLSKFEGEVLVGKNELGTRPTMRVDIVCLAFSLELYLKDLHQAVKGETPRGHNIRKLFEELPEDIRQKIFACDSISQNPFHMRGNVFSSKLYSSEYTPYDRFVDQIEAISNGFVKWRYSHEHTTLRYSDSFAVALIEAIKSVTDNVRRRNPLP